MTDYVINPVKTGGVVKEIKDGEIKINLFGRLGVIKAKQSLFLGEGLPKAGEKLEFYFGYVEITDALLDYDTRELEAQKEIEPRLVGGRLTEVNDAAAEIEIVNGLGTAAVPRRWIFTPVALKEGQFAQFYFSRLKRREN